MVCKSNLALETRGELSDWVRAVIQRGNNGGGAAFKIAIELFRLTQCAHTEHDADSRLICATTPPHDDPQRFRFTKVCTSFCYRRVELITFLYALNLR